MPNKHLEHPEDLILLGTDPNEVLDHLFMVHKLTTKWDGAPSIVFGNNNEITIGIFLSDRNQKSSHGTH